MRATLYVLFFVFPNLLEARERPSKAWLEEYEASPGENTLIKIGDKWLIPNLVGEDVGSLRYQDLLSSRYKNYKIKEVKRIKHKTIPKNVVICQDPEEGALVQKRGLIKVIVSDG